MEFKLDSGKMRSFKKRKLVIISVVLFISVFLSFTALNMAGIDLWIIIISISITVCIVFIIFHLTFLKKKRIEKLDWLYKIENERIIINYGENQEEIKICNISQLKIYRNAKKEIVNILIKIDKKHYSVIFIENIKIFVQELSIDKNIIKEINYNKKQNWFAAIGTILVVVCVMGLQIITNSGYLRIIFDKIIPIGGGIFLLFLPTIENSFLRNNRKNILAIALIFISIVGVYFDWNQYTKERKIIISEDLQIEFPEKPKKKNKEYDTFLDEIYYLEKNDIAYQIELITFKQEIIDDTNIMIEKILEGYINKYEYDIKNKEIVKNGIFCELENGNGYIEKYAILKLDRNKLIIQNVKTSNIKKYDNENVLEFYKGLFED